MYWIISEAFEAAHCFETRHEENSKRKDAVGYLSLFFLRANPVVYSAEHDTQRSRRRRHI